MDLINTHLRRCMQCLYKQVNMKLALDTVCKSKWALPIRHDPTRSVEKN